MGNKLILIGKSLIIAFAAGVAAWLPLAIYLGLGGQQVDGGYDFYAIHKIGLTVALSGSFMVGLPVAILVLFLASRHLVQAPSTLFMIAILAGVMMILASYVVGDSRHMILFGIPSFIAALTYAALGYLWIIKPQRKPLNV